MSGIRGCDEREEKSQGYVLRQTNSHLNWPIVMRGRRGTGEVAEEWVGARCYSG